MADYYHHLVTDKSFIILQDLKRRYDFILIGGWAVFFFTKSLKSKDIDCIVDHTVLQKFRTDYALVKNARLQKYEIHVEEVDVDIYVHHYSDLGIPIDVIEKNTVRREGFVLPRPEILLLLKQKAYADRQGTSKGEKDHIDIVSLLARVENFDWHFYKKIIAQHQCDMRRDELRTLLTGMTDVPELSLNQHAYSRLKKAILAQL